MYMAKHLIIIEYLFKCGDCPKLACAVFTNSFKRFEKADSSDLLVVFVVIRATNSCEEHRFPNSSMSARCPGTNSNLLLTICP